MHNRSGSIQSRHSSQKKVALTRILETDSYQEDELLKKTPRDGGEIKAKLSNKNESKIRSLDLTKTVNINLQVENKVSPRKKNRFRGTPGIFSSCDNSSRIIQLTLDSRPSSRCSSSQRGINGQEYAHTHHDLDFQVLHANIDKFRSSTGSSLKLSDFLRKGTKNQKSQGVAKIKKTTKKSNTLNSLANEKNLNKRQTSNFQIEVPRSNIEVCQKPTVFGNFFKDRMTNKAESQTGHEHTALHIPSELSSIKEFQPMPRDVKPVVKLTHEHVAAIRHTIMTGDPFEMNHYTQDVDDQIMKISDKLDRLLMTSKQTQDTSNLNNGDRSDIRHLAMRMNIELKSGSDSLARQLLQSSDVVESRISDNEDNVMISSFKVNNRDNDKFDGQDIMAKKVRNTLLMSENCMRSELIKKTVNMGITCMNTKRQSHDHRQQSATGSPFNRYNTQSHDHTRMNKYNGSIEHMKCMDKKYAIVKKPTNSRYMKSYIDAQRAKTLASSLDNSKSLNRFINIDASHIPYFYRKLIQNNQKAMMPDGKPYPTKTNAIDQKTKTISPASKKYGLYRKTDK